MRVRIRQASRSAAWASWASNRDRAHDACPRRGVQQLNGLTDVIPGTVVTDTGDVAFIVEVWISGRPVVSRWRYDNAVIPPVDVAARVYACAPKGNIVDAS
jgi:hypothetical protein